VLIDKEQHSFLLSMSRVGSYLVVKFTRKFTICKKDKQQDADDDINIDISKNGSHIIFAWNEEFSRSGDIVYHGRNRGNIFLNLINPVSNVDLTVSLFIYFFIAVKSNKIILNFISH
jgi:hypothetical protein